MRGPSRRPAGVRWALEGALAEGMPKGGAHRRAGVASPMGRRAGGPLCGSPLVRPAASAPVCFCLVCQRLPRAAVGARIRRFGCRFDWTVSRSSLADFATHISMVPRWLPLGPPVPSKGLGRLRKHRTPSLWPQHAFQGVENARAMVLLVIGINRVGRIRYLQRVETTAVPIQREREDGSWRGMRGSRGWRGQE